MSPMFFQLFLLFVWTPYMLAAPFHTQKRSFKVDRVRNPQFKRYNGPNELLKTYQKYRMPVPQDLLDSLRTEAVIVAAAGSVQSDTPKEMFQLEQVDATSRAVNMAGGIVSATPASGGIEYISPIRVGGQTINVVFDSGSADLWVFSTGLPALARAGHQVYDPLLSPTFKTMPRANFSILYGDGTTASGNVGTDIVDVGGATVVGQAVQMATSASPAFVQDTNLSGLLGLAFSQLSTVKPVKQRTFFENVMPSLAQPLFTADLPKDAVGAYEFGRIDRTKFVGRLSWIPADTSKGFWQVLTSGFRVGNGQTKLSAAQAIVDTGTTLMLVSKELSDSYYSQVPGAQRTPTAGGMTFPCNATLPDLLLDLGGVYTATVRGSDINFAKFTGDSRLLQHQPNLTVNTNASPACFGGIQPTTSNFQIWGGVFFRSQFVVFHGGNRSFGMAPHV